MTLELGTTSIRWILLVAFHKSPCIRVRPCIGCQIHGVGKLESTDAAGRVPHLSPTQDAASNTVACESVPRLSFFFFPLGFAPTWLDSRQFGFDSHLFTPNRADSAKIGPYRPYWVISAGNWNGRNRPKSALNLVGKFEIPTSKA